MDEYLDYDPEFEEFFAADQRRKWESGEYVNHCEGCAGEDCYACAYNPALDN